MRKYRRHPFGFRRSALSKIGYCRAAARESFVEERNSSNSSRGAWACRRSLFGAASSCEGQHTLSSSLPFIIVVLADGG